MKNHIDSNFAIAILVLVAACVGFAFWLLNASDDIALTQSHQLNKSSASHAEKKSSVDTSTWETYLDKQNDFQISYPDQWNVRSGEYGYVYFTESVEAFNDPYTGEVKNESQVGVDIEIPFFENQGDDSQILRRTSTSTEKTGFARSGSKHIVSDKRYTSTTETFTIGSYDVISYRPEGLIDTIAYLVYDDTNMFYMTAGPSKSDIAHEMIKTLEFN